MNKTMTQNGVKRKRTKQTLAAPRHIGPKDGSFQVNKLVWVLVGKTEHQAYLLEEPNEHDTVLVRWESTRVTERVPVLSIRYDLPGRSSRRKQAQIFRYDEQYGVEGVQDVVRRPRKEKRNSRGTKKRKLDEQKIDVTVAAESSQQSFLPEQKILVEDKSTLNKDPKVPVPTNDKPQKVAPTISKDTAPQRNPGPLKKRCHAAICLPSNQLSSNQLENIVQNTEVIDDMALVSRFMSILSRLDDDSDCSDAEDSDASSIASEPNKKSALSGDSPQNGDSNETSVAGKPEFLYPLSKDAFDYMTSYFYDQVEASLYMFCQERSQTSRFRRE